MSTVQDFMNIFNEEPLYAAAKTGNTAQLQRLIPITSADAHNKALKIAQEANQTESVQLLLAAIGSTGQQRYSVI